MPYDTRQGAPPGEWEAHPAVFHYVKKKVGVGEVTVCAADGRDWREGGRRHFPPLSCSALTRDSVSGVICRNEATYIIGARRMISGFSRRRRS